MATRNLTSMTDDRFQCYSKTLVDMLPETHNSVEFNNHHVAGWYRITHAIATASPIFSWTRISPLNFAQRCQPKQETNWISLPIEEMRQGFRQITQDTFTIYWNLPNAKENVCNCATFRRGNLPGREQKSELKHCQKSHKESIIITLRYNRHEWPFQAN